MKRVLSLTCLCLLLITICGCAGIRASRTFYAMDTVMQLEAYGDCAESALEAAEREIYRLEAQLSCREPDAALARLNTAGSGTVSEQTAALLRTALELSEKTGGAYDPALYPLMCAWGFTTADAHVPSDAQITALRKTCGAQHVSVNGCRVELSNGAQLDLGGIAKGYAAGCIRRSLTEAGVRSALLSLGGNVAVIGSRPDGRAWSIGLQDPDDSAACFGTVSVRDACVVTSGGYQRYFEQNGVRYHHILDPKTGYPAQSGLKSVSIVAKDDTLADALSTALFVMGLDKGAAFQKTSGLSFEAIFVTEDNTVWITPGLVGTYRSDRAYKVVES